MRGVAYAPSSYSSLYPTAPTGTRSQTGSRDINNVPALVATVKTHGRTLNVLLSNGNDLWVYEGDGVTTNRTQSWSTRNPTLPQGLVTLQDDQTIDTVRPESLDAWSTIIVGASDFGTSPSEFDSSKRAVLHTLENQQWATPQVVTGSETLIDELTDGDSYEVAGAVRSWATGPYARATGTSGGTVSSPVLSVPDPAIGHDEIIIPIEVESEERIREICVEYRGSLIIGEMEGPWRTLICRWKGGVFQKSGFTQGSMIDLRVTAKVGPPPDPESTADTSTAEAVVVKRGIVIGYTEDAEQIFPGWVDRPYDGNGNLYRLTGTLFDKQDGWKQWIPRSIELSLDAEYEEYLSSVGGRLRGLWKNGRYYSQHDQVEHYVAVTVEGSSFEGLATYRSKLAHTGSSDNRPTGLGNDTWTLIRLPDNRAESAPTPPPGEVDDDLPDPEGTDIEYNRAISENSVGEDAFVNRLGEYKFGLGSGAAYTPANYDWSAVKTSTRLAIAQRDKHGISQSRLLQSLVYAASEGTGIPERVIAMFDGGSRRVEMLVSGGRVSINGERVRVDGKVTSYNEEGGTHDLNPTEDVTFRIHTDDYPIENEVTNAALPPNIVGGSLEGVPSSGQIVATWELPPNEDLTHMRIYVRKVLGKGLGLLALLPPTATTHTFTSLPGGSYFLYALTQNAAGVFPGVAAKSGPYIVT